MAIGKAADQEPTVYEKQGCVVGSDELIVQALNDIVIELRAIKETISRLKD